MLNVPERLSLTPEQRRQPITREAITQALALGQSANEAAQRVREVLESQGPRPALRELASAGEAIDPKRAGYKQEGHFSPKEDAKKLESLDNPDSVEKAREKMKKISLIQAGLDLLALGKTTGNFSGPEKEILAQYGLDSSEFSNSADELINKAMMELYLQGKDSFFSSLSQTKNNSTDTIIGLMKELCINMPELRENLMVAVGQWRIEELARIREKPPESPLQERERLRQEILGGEGTSGKLNNFLSELGITLDKDKINAFYLLMGTNPDQALELLSNKLSNEPLIVTPKKSNSPNIDIERDLRYIALWEELVHKVKRIQELEKVKPEEFAAYQKIKQEYEAEVRGASLKLDSLVEQALAKSYEEVVEVHDRLEQDHLKEKAKQAAQQGEQRKAQYYLNRASRWIEETGVGQPKTIHLNRIRTDLMLVKNLGREMGGKYLVAQALGLIPDFPPVKINNQTFNSPLEVPDHLWEIYLKDNSFKDQQSNDFKEEYNSLSGIKSRAEWFAKIIASNPELNAFLENNKGIIDDHLNQLFGAYLKAEEYRERHKNPIRRWRSGYPDPNFDGDIDKFKLTKQELADLIDKYGSQWEAVVTNNERVKASVEQMAKRLGIKEPIFGERLTNILKIISILGGGILLKILFSHYGILT
jgi:hypothetical protein